MLLLHIFLFDKSSPDVIQRLDSALPSDRCGSRFDSTMGVRPTTLLTYRQSRSIRSSITRNVVSTSRLALSDLTLRGIFIQGEVDVVFRLFGTSLQMGFKERLARYRRSDIGGSLSQANSSHSHELLGLLKSSKVKVST